MSLLRLAVFAAVVLPRTGAAAPAPLRLAHFSADVTIPLGHRCMGILPVKARRIVDPLEARGIVLLGAGRPIVLVAVDWCEIRNDAYDAWRDALARAAGTDRRRVLVSSLHQHDAPVVDLGAERLLASVGLPGELHDVAFHREALARVAAALKKSLAKAQPITHIGLGEARVERVASNRRVVMAEGRVTFDRGSASGGVAALRDAPEGLIDPWLKTLSFWNGQQPVAAISGYATHPMSYYGKGEVSADFVGMARRRRQRETPEVFQIYVSGCSGDVTAGKYNDAAPANRAVLADRIYRAMRAAWQATRRSPIRAVALRTVPLELPFRQDAAYRPSALRATLEDDQADVRSRILAAMALASRQRVAARRAIDLVCLDFGVAQLVLLPGESFVGYQWMAQRIRSDAFVLAIGYGECWPGYIPTRAAFEDRFDSKWLWVAPGAASRMRSALWKVLRQPIDVRPPGNSKGAEGDIRVDVFPATAEHPRNSEGSVAALRDGRLLLANTRFLGGGADDAAAEIVGTTSADGGRTWSDPRILQPNTGGCNVMSATLRSFRSPVQSGLGLFYLVKNGPADLKVYLRVSADGGATFGRPQCVTDAPGYHVMNNDRVTQLLDGRLLCPISWSPDITRKNHFVCFCYYSDNGGRSWRRSEGDIDLPKRGAMEPEVIERADGSLLMILRTQLGQIYAATSTDRGKTWSDAAPWGVVAPEAPATLRRIPSTGDLLLVWNPRHAAGADHGGRRTPLGAAISRDEGQTWGPPRLLESRENQTYAYTSLTFVGDRAVLSYYVADEATGRISTRFRSLPLAWFYRRDR